ncbi:uncharacterized protein LOC143297749 [Babylonia areolata]|uniref:uncharacterized protein LOC143297749 n=1 Tax=Babylonia areolata TaxID=304850 RepID=UPI003FD4F9B2
MATSYHLVRSLCNRLSVCDRILQNRIFSGTKTQWSGFPAMCFPARFQHSDSASDSSSANTPAATAAEAEKTPVVIDNELILKLLQDSVDDKPVSNMPDPFQKEHKRCILCEHNLEVNYKNVRLLSQFVSPYTGRIYGRAVTGLCIPMQKEVARAIKQSRSAGYMPYMFKKSEYLKDPRLFDPFKTAR